MYPLPNIDCLIGISLGCKTLSFMDAYSRYNQIKMDHVDAPKTTFISNHGNYYYNVMPFGIKNKGITYPRLMDPVLLKYIGHNLEVTLMI